MHQEGLRFLLRDPLGPMGRYIDVKAREVDFQAHLNVAGAGPGPGVRSTDLHNSIRYGGLETDTDGNLVAYIVSDAVHRGFPYPLAQELGVPDAFPAPRNQPGQRYRNPFLRPALESAFSHAISTV